MQNNRDEKRSKPLRLHFIYKPLLFIRMKWSLIWSQSCSLYTMTLIILLCQTVMGRKSDVFFGVNNKMHRWRKVSVVLRNFWWERNDKKMEGCVREFKVDYRASRWRGQVNSMRRIKFLAESGSSFLPIVIHSQEQSQPVLLPRPYKIRWGSN